MSRSSILLVLLIAACQPPGSGDEPEPTTAAAPIRTMSARTPGCHEDIPDCAAACALRETGRTEHLDWFDRRCAAVKVGENPDRAVPEPTPPVATASVDNTARHDLQTTPYDPFTAKRDGEPDPAECRAAQVLRARGQQREADVLAAMCFAKGGGAAALGPADAGAMTAPPDTRH